MTKKNIIIVLFILVGIAVVYNSVYFEKLDQKKQQERFKKFNPRELVDYFWKNELNKTFKKAISLNQFDSLLTVNPVLLAEQYGITVGISSNYSVLVNGIAQVMKDNQGNITIKRDGKRAYRIATKYIFGNTARNASGYFDIDFFENTMDFNAVSAELNKRIKNEVVANTVGLFSGGDTISVTGAVEFNLESIASDFEIIPFKLERVRK